MKKIKLKAPAKINLTLEVVKKLPTGFHKLRTVMLKLEELSDELTFSFNENSEQVLTKTNNSLVPDDENNLCYKATQLFFDQTRLSVGVLIDIEKNIPVSAGLGGGSSDAATTLMALNRYFGYPINNDRLMRMASELGKDIPFFLQNKNCALMTGLGDKLEKAINLSWKKSFLIINPRIEISTKQAYQGISENVWYMSKLNRFDISEEFFSALKKGDSERLSLLHNDFEIGAISMHPEILTLKNSLKAFGAQASLMSGSGSTVFGIFENKKLAQEAQVIFSRKYPEFLVKAC